MKLGVAFAWHTHPWEELLALVRLAEELGFSAAFVDGDVSMLASKSERDVLHGWTVAMALLARTERIQIGSIRLVHHWNAAQLAQAVATAERLTPGRLRCVIAAGDRPNDANFGFPDLPVGERIRLLDETLEAMQCLWRGETVTRSGRYVQLERARVRPIPPGGAIPIAIAARGPRMPGAGARPRRDSALTVDLHAPRPGRRCHRRAAGIPATEPLVRRVPRRRGPRQPGRRQGDRLPSPAVRTHSRAVARTSRRRPVRPRRRARAAPHGSPCPIEF
ncbi:MAG: LLM class flavin-dependent oxidoreductase [Deltaproteobacteria bacterium]|nr:LLM class flavin-dependent oxidoreductase [Deltaproteobacteria bacterium]